MAIHIIDERQTDALTVKTENVWKDVRCIPLFRILFSCLRSIRLWMREENCLKIIRCL